MLFTVGFNTVDGDLNQYKIVPLFGAAYPSKVLNPTVNSKIQGLFKAFERFSSTFQGRFSFQGLYKKALYIQVLFKPVQTMCCC